MKLGAALAILALAALTPSAPASAAKDEKLPRCNGRQKRPANLYGTVLPSIPPRNATSAAETAPADGVPRGTPPSQSAPATNLFPADGAASAPEGADASRTGKVPAIGKLTPNGGPTAALSISYASC
jgi:hypothetical protein